MEIEAQTLQKSYYRFLTDFIETHMNILRQARIFIFGAGVRGCNLLWVLKSFHLSDIYFVDNNVNKQGTRLENCSILSFHEADQYTQRHIFLCPIEHGEEILEQLKASGREENSDYFNLDFSFTDYLAVEEEIKTPAEDYSLLFGSCELSSYILTDAILPSLGEVLKERLFQTNCKLCTLPGFYSVIYYHVIQACLKAQKRPPKFTVIVMEQSSLSPYEPLLMGEQNYRQHVQFLERLAIMMPENQELEEYLNKVRERLKRSKSGSNPTKAENTLEAQRRVYKLKYLYQLRETDESVSYTRRILELLEEKGIPAILLFPPVDYQRGIRICGEDFMERYNAVVEQMKSFLNGLKYHSIDASFIATSEYFVPPTPTPDVNPFLNEKGQKLLEDFLKGQPTLRPFLAIGDAEIEQKG